MHSMHNSPLNTQLQQNTTPIYSPKIVYFKQEALADEEYIAQLLLEFLHFQDVDEDFLKNISKKASQYPGS